MRSLNESDIMLRIKIKIGCSLNLDGSRFFYCDVMHVSNMLVCFILTVIKFWKKYIYGV